MGTQPITRKHRIRKLHTISYHYIYHTPDDLAKLWGVILVKQRLWNDERLWKEVKLKRK
jgi:hypothetical protein